MKKTLHLNGLVFLVIILACGTGLLHPLDPAKEINQYNHEIFTTGSGLPQSSVLSIIRTSDGYLWMATYEGLARFDGIRFRVFDKSNTPEMESNRIKTLCEDHTGTLWAGTSAGLLRFRNGKFKKYTTGNGLSNDFVLCITEGKPGTIWVGTTDGLNRLENETFTIYTRKHGLSHNHISALVTDSSGCIGIGTAEGLNTCKPVTGEIKHRAAETGLAGNE
ncbi:MAG: hypothetical protein GY950_01660, partial [bacterium]|nr:hypothetical protein [bacterium]